MRLFGPYYVRRRLWSVCGMPQVLERDSAFVEAAYDRSWPEYSNLDRLVPGSLESVVRFCDGPNKRDFRLVDDRFRYIGLHEYRRLHQALIERTLRQYLRPDDVCYEFGCGNGRNLLSLAMHVSGIQFRGCDISKAGVELVQAAAARLGLGIDVEKLDYLHGDVGKAMCDVAFTHYSLEQIPRRFPDAVRKIIGATRRFCMFFEPIADLYPHDLRGLASLAYRHKQDYMGGLVDWLMADGFKVIRAERAGFAPKIFSEMCVVVVEAQ